MSRRHQMHQARQQRHLKPSRGHDAAGVKWIVVGKPSCVTVVPCASNAECRKSRFTRRRPCQVLLKKTLCHGHHIMREAPKTLEMSFWVTCSSALMLQISASEALQSFANVMDMSVCRFWRCSGHHSLTKRLRHALFFTRAMHFLFI